MDKFIGVDIDHKHTLACVVQVGHPDRYRKLRTDVGQLREWLKTQRRPGDRPHLTFEVSVLSGHLYDGLVDVVDRLEVSNPTKLSWIYRTAKKNDRIDARKQAVLLSMNELLRVHMPREGVREWRRTIQHRRNVVNTMTQTKNRIRSLLKSQGLKKAHRGTWWNTTNRTWMRREADRGDAPRRDVLGDLLDMLELPQRQLQRVTRRLDAHLDKLSGASLLIPGVGPRTVEAVLAYPDEVRRFPRGKQYDAYFGLTPRLDESGSRRRTGHISKEGPSVVRWLIVESAWRTVRNSPALRLLRTSDAWTKATQQDCYRRYGPQAADHHAGHAHDG